MLKPREYTITLNKLRLEYPSTFFSEEELKSILLAHNIKLTPQLRTAGILNLFIITKYGKKKLYSFPATPIHISRVRLLLANYTAIATQYNRNASINKAKAIKLLASKYTYKQILKML